MKLLPVLLLLVGCDIVGGIAPEEWRKAQSLCESNGGIKEVKSATLAFRVGNQITVECNNGLGKRFVSP